VAMIPGIPPFSLDLLATYLSLQISAQIVSKFENTAPYCLI